MYLSTNYFCPNWQPLQHVERLDVVSRPFVLPVHGTHGQVNKMPGHTGTRLISPDCKHAGIKPFALSSPYPQPSANAITGTAQRWLHHFDPPISKTQYLKWILTKGHLQNALLHYLYFYHTLHTSKHLERLDVSKKGLKFVHTYTVVLNKLHACNDGYIWKCLPHRNILVWNLVFCLFLLRAVSPAGRVQARGSLRCDLTISFPKVLFRGQPFDEFQHKVYKMCEFTNSTFVIYTQSL